ncbi:hypothetical protein JOF56_003695 [Kibdelosporangium banguiense]|uniref:Uncharacterized protein n=1 Tax=Kibdelosporangium banguiense TaxID=1365924 RepID=A0ABS4TFW7_9PSEU|nr:hypothetical protein [Kibdelosporangium banguiense]
MTVVWFLLTWLLVALLGALLLGRLIHENEKRG